MLEKKILIAGLPDAGKSTYIAALNGVMSQEGDFCLTPADKASEWVYVNELTKNGCNVKSWDIQQMEKPSLLNGL